MNRQRWYVAVLVAVAISGLAGAAGASVPSSPLPQGMVDLGSLDPPESGDNFANWSQAFGINDLGQVVGETGFPGSSGLHPFLWTKVGGMQNLGLPPGSDSNERSTACAINNAGEIIVSNWPDVFAWKYKLGEAQPWLQLGQFSNGGTKGNAINQKGEAAGQAWAPRLDTPAGYWNWQACKWSAGGAVVNLGMLPGNAWGSAPSSEAHAINDAGVVVGESTTPGNTDSHAVRWDAAGTITDLGAQLEPDPTKYQVWSVAFGINNNGTVVGFYSGPATGGSKHACLWTAAGDFVDLGTLPIGTYSVATAINDLGQVTGYSDNGYVDFHGPHAFRWEGGLMSDLGPLGNRYQSCSNYYYCAYSSKGYAINKFGQVAGESAGKDSSCIEFSAHAFFIDPKWPAGLQAYYPFSGNAQDVSGHGYDGQVFGATLTNQGYWGQAYSFNGIDNYIMARLDISPSQQWDVTMGAWVKAAATADSVLLGNNSVSGRAIGITGGNWSAFFGPDDGHWLQADPVVPGDWVFLAASYDQTAQTLKFYVNDKVYTKTGATLFLNDGEPYLRIGAQKDVGFGGMFFNGVIDEVFIFNGVLSDAQIAAIRTRGVPLSGKIAAILPLLLQ
jgi:probable HAF family extracellular repeat protein